MTTYHCPKCGRQSNTMKLLEDKHRPSAMDTIEFDVLATEMLECKCGQILWWGVMRRREENK